MALNTGALIGYGLAVLALMFLLGALTGNHLLTRHQHRRSLRIAEAQRRLNEHAQAQE